MKILIKNGRVVDPANSIDEVRDILIEGGRIAKAAKNIKTTGAKVIDAANKIVMPGMVDMHVHLREPGREDKETVASATRAALKGGITTVLAMPNTEPAIDSPEAVKLIKNIIQKTSQATTLICAAITKGRAGKELTDIASLKRLGVAAISDDGTAVELKEVLSLALKTAKENKIPVICHCEDKALAAGGVVNLGFVSTRLGLKGISKESEYKRVERDIRIAQRSKTPIHIAHVSCKESVEAIGLARKKGVEVTAEASPHHFALTEESVLEYDTNMKMNPPLRSREDVEAIKNGLKRGIIDCIASDHAPHTENEKDIEFDRAEFGVIGLETALAVSITELVETGILSWPELVRKVALNPARILKLDTGQLGVGRDADIIVVSPKKTWVVKKEEIVSKSKNSPFLGKTLFGVVEYTIRGGKIAYQG